MGTLMAKYGAACDNLLSAEVVTVDGKQVEASPNSNADLFWAIRGGGGNFGVATALEYRLHQVNEVLAGALTYPAGRLSELLQTYAKVSAAAPDEMAMISQVLPSEQGARFRICHAGVSAIRFTQADLWGQSCTCRNKTIDWIMSGPK